MEKAKLTKDLAEAIEIEVSEQAEEFYLFYPKGWKKGVGHKIRVDDLYFSLIPAPIGLIVSEVESGQNLCVVPTDDIWEHTNTQEKTIRFFSVVIGPAIAELIQKVGVSEMKEIIAKSKKKATLLHGEQPKRNKVDTDWITADIRDTLH